MQRPCPIGRGRYLVVAGPPAGRTFGCEARARERRIGNHVVGLPHEARPAMSPREVERTWLELRSPPASPPVPAPHGAALVQLHPCPTARYRQLYGAVGGPWNWVERAAWPDERLAAHLADPDVAVWEATRHGALAGYFELRNHPDRSVEIAYFGLVPTAIGTGLGRWLLEAAVAAAWALEPERVWLHTCSDDHPAALPNYLRRGFQITRVERIPAAGPPG